MVYKANFESIRNIAAYAANNFLNRSDINTPILILYGMVLKRSVQHGWNKLHPE